MWWDNVRHCSNVKFASEISLVSNVLARGAIITLALLFVLRPPEGAKLDTSRLNVTFFSSVCLLPSFPLR